MDIHRLDQRSFVACMDGVYQLNLDTGEHQRLYQHDSYVSGVVVIHEADLVVSAGYDGWLYWYDLTAQSVVRRVRAHSFWSWDLARADKAPIVASSTGQYLAGSYRYEPRSTDEPCIRVYHGVTGELLSAFSHGPPVQSVALNADGSLVGAGNLMGDAAVWQVGGAEQAKWNTPDFTGFGIIKSHCYVGGLHAAAFEPRQDHLLVAGMGPMRDPMAGNGKQRWQQFDWQGASVRKIAESKNDEMGEGLMETLTFHPRGNYFVMAGRLRGGSWNTGFFDAASGELIHSLKTDTRVTKAVFSPDGGRLCLAGADKQSGKAEKQFGVIDVYEVSITS